jgi:serine/threonine-protein kinase
VASREEQSPAGRQIGQYKVLRVIGRGGMGVVYLAEDTRLGRTVALKSVAPRFTADEGRRERLRREARAAASLSHPGIATVYALEEFSEQLYIAS